MPLNLLVCILVTASTTSQEFIDFNKVALIEPASITKLWGPADKSIYENIGAQKYLVLPYKAKRSEFWIDEKKNKIVQKIYFPHPKTNLAILDSVLSNEFADRKFEKIKMKCSRHGEIIFLERNSGLFLNTRASAKAQVFAITYANRDVIASILKENEIAQCKWWRKLLGINHVAAALYF